MQSVKQGDLIKALGPHDILCGRGSGPNDYRGNIKFRVIIYERRAEYLASKTRRGKAQIARDIVDHVKSVFEPPGRFLKKIDISTANSLGLKRGSPVWIQVNESKALEKVKQALRQNREYLAGNKISNPTHRPDENSSNQTLPVSSVGLTKKMSPKRRTPIVKKHGLKSAIEKLKSAEDVLRAYSANRNAKMMSQPPRLQGMEPPCIYDNSGAFNSHQLSSGINLFEHQNHSSGMQSVLSRHTSSLASTIPRMFPTDISKILSHLAPSKGAASNPLENPSRNFTFLPPQSLAGNSSLSYVRPPSSNHAMMCQNFAPGCPTMIPHNLDSGSASRTAHHLSPCDLDLSSHNFPPRNFTLTSQNLSHGNSALVGSHDLLSRNLTLASRNLSTGNPTLISQDSSPLNHTLQLHNIPSRNLTLKSQSLPPVKPTLTSQNLTPRNPTLTPHDFTSMASTFKFQYNLPTIPKGDYQEGNYQKKDINLPIPDHQTSGSFSPDDSIGSEDVIESVNPLLKWTKCSDEYYTKLNEKPNITMFWRRKRR